MSDMVVNCSTSVRGGVAPCVGKPKLQFDGQKWAVVNPKTGLDEFVFSSIRQASDWWPYISRRFE